MEEIIKILYEGDFSCVIHNHVTRTFSKRGVADLYELLTTEPSFLNGALIADKVIGKAAAALMILGGVKQIYTHRISSSALALLREAGIEPNFKEEVPFIQNRDKTDWCPMEKLCYNEKSASDILPIIEEFINSLRANK